MEQDKDFSALLDEADMARQLVRAAEQVMDVESYARPRPVASTRWRPSPPTPDVEIRGRLRVEPGRAYDWVSETFGRMGHIALLRRTPNGSVIQAIRGSIVATQSRSWVAAVLFAATVVSVLWMGALQEEAASGQFDLLAGWPFAVSLLAILGAHEMGHYVVACRLGIPSSLPYFIPMPLSFLGTMGAVMQMKAPPRNRRHLLALGAAGPLAGFIVAVPVLLIGLDMSVVQVMPPGGGYLQEGNSLLYLGLKYLMFGQVLPSNGVDVLISPVAMAGWAGLLVTALNLIPAGQLDGGHILYALIGDRARQVTWGIMVVLAGLSILWQGWLIWLVLIFFLGQVHAVPNDDVTELRPWQRGFAILMLIIAALVFVPIPAVIT